MILPERVLGRPGANWITSGFAIGERCWRDVLLQFARSASEDVSPALSVTKA